MISGTPPVRRALPAAMRIWTEASLTPERHSPSATQWSRFVRTRPPAKGSRQHYGRADGISTPRPATGLSRPHGGFHHAGGGAGGGHPSRAATGLHGQSGAQRRDRGDAAARHLAFLPHGRAAVSGSQMGEPLPPIRKGWRHRAPAAPPGAPWRRS